MLTIVMNTCLFYVIDGHGTNDGQNCTAINRNRGNDFLIDRMMSVLFQVDVRVLSPSPLPCPPAQIPLFNTSLV